MSARLLGVALAALLFVGAAEACSWVVIQPDEYKGAPGFWAVWHAIWHRNAWVVVAAYDNAKALRAGCGARVPGRHAPTGGGSWQSALPRGRTRSC